MSHRLRNLGSICGCLLLLVSGCKSASYTGNGALLGGLGGAGVGALIGHATGNTGAGAAIGAGVGALSGAAVGTALDDIEAKNRAEIAAQMGRPVVQGAATFDEVIAMTQAGVEKQLIVNYVNGAGMAQPVNAPDVIYLHQRGVATEVIQAMQTPRVAAAPVRQVTVVQEAPPPIIVEEYYGRPYYYGPRYHHHYGRGGPRVGWGMSFSN